MTSALLAVALNTLTLNTLRDALHNTTFGLLPTIEGEGDPVYLSATLNAIAATGANGTLRSDCGLELRICGGRIVRWRGSLRVAIESGLFWSWREVVGKPNGDMDTPLSAALLAVAFEMHEARIARGEA